MSAIATTISSIDRSIWLDARRRYIGASDLPAVLGVDTHRSALDVYLDKRGMTADKELTEAMEAGIELEEPVLRWYAKRTGKTIRHNTALYLSSMHSWLACTPDGFEPNGDTVQVKCSGRTSAWDEQIPDYVYVQVQAEMLCLGTRRSVALALVSGWGGFSLKPYDVGRDEAIIGRIVAAGEDMARRIAEGDPPDPDGSKAAGNALRKMFPAEVADTSVLLDLEAAEQTVQLAGVDAQLKELNRQREEIRQRIQMKLGDAECGQLPGGGLWTWKTQERAGYTVEPTSMRVLRHIKPKKAK